MEKKLVSEAITVLSDYIQAGMKKAHYEILEDNTFYANIPGVQGVYANEPSLEACREELQSVLEDWILFSLQEGCSLPPIDGIDLNVAKSA